MAVNVHIQDAIQQGEGILRLAPVFVPRRFGQAGRRLRLHPDDYYALGTARGSIKERWFASVIPCMNGPLAPADEGYSYVQPVSGNPKDRFTLCEAVETLKADLIGQDLIDKYGNWPMYSKFFDYDGPLFHHLHLDQASAERVGRIGKPESYFFPRQLNNTLGQFPHTYFGWDPDTTREEVRQRLLQYEAGDNRITELSRAYRVELGTGWYTPPGVVHAPGSVLTYEPQWNSDVNSVYENIAAGEIYPYDFLVENCPDDKKRNVDYVMSLMDWEKNVDPHYKLHYFRPPIACPHNDPAHQESWIAYANDYIAAKELTVAPGASVVVSDPVAYGCVVIQGQGRFGVHATESVTMLRYGQLSGDEFFVSQKAAVEGIRIVNASAWEPLVMLKHFGPNHPQMPKTRPDIILSKDGISNRDDALSLM